MAGSFGRPLSVLLQNGRRLLVKGPTIRGFCCTGRLTNGTNGTVTSRTFSSAQPLTQKETVTIHFVMPDGKRKAAKAKLGDSLLDVVLENNLDIDGYGACEGTLACSTCHIVFKEEHFKKISIKPTDEELDMLDLAYGLSDTLKSKINFATERRDNEAKVKGHEVKAEDNEVEAKDYWAGKDQEAKAKTRRS